MGGRIGAAQGPSAFWKIFQKLRGKEPILELMEGPQWIQPQENDISRLHKEVIQKWRQRSVKSRSLS